MKVNVKNNLDVPVWERTEAGVLEKGGRLKTKQIAKTGVESEAAFWGGAKKEKNFGKISEGGGYAGWVQWCKTHVKANSQENEEPDTILQTIENC